jgi:hypothetical protein
MVAHPYCCDVRDCADGSAAEVARYGTWSRLAMTTQATASIGKNESGDVDRPTGEPKKGFFQSTVSGEHEVSTDVASSCGSMTEEQIYATR